MVKSIGMYSETFSTAVHHHIHHSSAAPNREVVDRDITETELAAALMYVSRIQFKGWRNDLMSEYLNEQTVTRLMTTSMIMVLEISRHDEDMTFSIAGLAHRDGWSPVDLIEMMREFKDRLDDDFEFSALSMDYLRIVQDLRKRTVPVQETRERILRWLEEVDTFSKFDARKQIDTTAKVEKPETTLTSVFETVSYAESESL